jgi:D-alanyl-D-alanine carboxypeptidase/D-alanyl-D-alanine-endopeptidase (penicillin-binding protein 4)
VSGEAKARFRTAGRFSPLAVLSLGLIAGTTGGPSAPAASLAALTPPPSAAAATLAASPAAVSFAAPPPAASPPPAAAATVQPAPPSFHFTAALDAEVRAALRVAPAIGVHVVELDAGETVYSWSADEPRIAASNTKLFTTAAALDALGPGYLFETRLLARGRVRDGVLLGDLGVVGGGDPSISGRGNGDPYAVFRDWAAALRRRGIGRVEGDLLLDHGLFDDGLVHPDWPPDQLTSWYEAPVAGLSFNDNCVLVRVWPGGQGGGAPRVELAPPVPLLEIENSARTVASRRGQFVHIGRRGDRIEVRGKIWYGSGPVETWVTVPDPVAWFGAAVRDAFSREGVEIAGSPLPVERLPGPLWRRVAVHRSDLLEAVRVTNKRSQNFYAESLLKVLAAERCDLGTWRHGVREVEDFLAAIGIPRGGFTMADGSGMSRANRFTPRQLTTLLRHMYSHPAGAEFVQSMPYGGEDTGSWKKRLADPPYAGNVYAKTGTLDGVSALSGYARALSGKTYAFSILCNETRSAADARRAQDRIVMALVDNG